MGGVEWGMRRDVIGSDLVAVNRRAVRSITKRGLTAPRRRKNDLIVVESRLTSLPPTRVRVLCE